MRQGVPQRDVEPGAASRDLRQQIDTCAVIDAHEHLRSHDQSQPRDDVVDFLIESYLGCMLPYVDPALAVEVTDTSRPQPDRWKAFVSTWPLVRCTGYGNLIARMLKSWELSDDLTERTCDQVRDRLRQRSPDASRAAYRAAGIEHTITHFLGHPGYGGLEGVAGFLAGSLSFDEGFHPLLGTLGLHEFFDREGVATVGRISDITVSGLGDLVRAIDVLIAKTVQRGVVGLKDHAAYTRGLNFGPPDRSAAEGELSRLLSGERFEAGARRLSDYLFDHIVKQAIDHDVPMVIHTGYLAGGADPKANVRGFAPVIQAHPQARFDLYHLNYPWIEDLLAILKLFPNTWANCCWTHIIDPAATVDFLRQALGAVPANHIVGFGGDLPGLPEPVLAHLDIARDNIAWVLGEAVSRKWCSQQTALDIARLWLYENPRSLYRL